MLLGTGGTVAERFSTPIRKAILILPQLRLRELFIFYPVKYPLQINNL
jgi:hypothetical protein